jgi:hypothetical protein
MKKSIGNVSRIRMNVYLRLRSERRNSSSQMGPQYIRSIVIGVEQTTQCLCLGTVVFCSVFRYLDMAKARSPAAN